jgi:uncharacterized protein
MRRRRPRTTPIGSRMQPTGIGRRLALGLSGLALSASVAATSVEGLYEGTVPGDAASAGRAAVATEALKQVVVRLTGRRAAATDPALTALFSDPLRFASTYRSVSAGQVAVGFEATGLDAALLAAGQRLWGRERPLTLVVVIPQRPLAPPTLMGASQDLRREIERSAQQRGVPLAWPTGVEGATLQARYADALAGRLEPLQALARQFGAAGVLLGRAQPGGGNWSWLGPAGEGSYAGATDDAIQALADRYGAQFASQATTPGGVLTVSVRGVRELAGYAAATQTLAALEGVREVALEEAEGETLRFRLSYAGDTATLRQAAQGGRLAFDDEAPADGSVHFVLRP